MSFLFRNFRYKVLALMGATLLWGVANSESSIERGFDIPVVRNGVPADLVVTDATTDSVNVRVRGSRSALRRLSIGNLEYGVDLTGARPGTTSHEVDLTGLALPRGIQVVSRSPSSIDFTLERKGTKAVRVRADLDGELAPGFQLAKVEVDPPRVRITGARSEVLRLNELLTETIDVTGASASFERKVRPSLAGRQIWIDGDTEVTVRVQIEPIPTDAAKGAPAPGKAGKQ